MRDIPKNGCERVKKMRKNRKKANDTSSGGNTLPDPKYRIENYNFSLPLPSWYFCIRAWRV